MKCRYFCRLPLDISPVYLTRGISFTGNTEHRLIFLLRFYLDRICAVFFVSGCRIYFCLLCFTIFEEVYSYLREQSVG